MRLPVLFSHKSDSSHGNKEPGRRVKMVAAQVFEVLSSTVTSMLEDPRLLEVSVTHVELTPDLSLAKVYVSSATRTADLEAAVVALTKAAGFLRRQLAAELTLRRVPELKFFPDTVLIEAWKLDDVLSGIQPAGQPPKNEDEK